MARSFHPFFLGLLVAIVLSSLGSTPTVSQTIVRYLPGFDGPLPFRLETGYIGVGDLDEDQLFYYFVESQNNPKEDPLLLWLSGGPGCSGWSALVYEIGPLSFKNEKCNGSVPSLAVRKHSWNKIANIIYIDSPVWAGFSYSTIEGVKIGDMQAANELYDFLRKWLLAHPQFAPNHLYIGGDTYSGIIAPLLLNNIACGCEAGHKPILNLKGYVLGNPLTDYRIDHGSFVPFARGMGLISEELYQLAKKSCNEEYSNPCSPECEKYVQEIIECISGLNPNQILEYKCRPDPPVTILEGRRSIKELDPRTLPKFGCREYVWLLSYYWANEESVRKALHVREGTVGEWKRCNYDIPYVKEVQSTLRLHLTLAAEGYRALIYSGDHTLGIPNVGTRTWIRALDFPIVDEWRPWTVNGQVAGYTRKYANDLTFATVLGAGNTAAEYKPKQCLAMFERWISHKPL